jgi:hypothetical protein
MRRLWTLVCLVSAVVALTPHYAAAGGSEFPASGTRNLGRGGTGLTRADDPTLMLRNPALLADLWDDVAYTGMHVLLAKSCFQATGNYGWGASGDDAVDLGQGPLLVNLTNAKTPDGAPLTSIRDEPFPKVCYEGPVPILPNIGLSMKLAPNLGVGLGFFPPDNAALSQFGNRDGTVDTAAGLRPSPTRWFRSHLNTSYFSALGAIGYRPLSWLRFGLGFQWALVVYSATEFTRPVATRSISSDIRVDVTGRDLFIPGVIASVQVNPIDNLDIAVGFKWSDRIESRAKLDITTSNFGSPQAVPYVDQDGDAGTVPGLVRARSDNRLGNVSSPPIWVPQLSLGVRYADRLAPRPKNDQWQAAHAAAPHRTQDSMATERWDVEANAIVYFNGANDVSRFVSANEKVITQSIARDGSLGLPLNAYVGQCAGKISECREREVPVYIHGKTQLSLRLGGDYNIIPGMLSVRAGFSYETNGQDPEYLNVTNYMLGRTGLHVGATWRIQGGTDLSIGFAHFIQRDIALAINPARPLDPRSSADPQKYHVASGANNGVAKFAIPDASDSVEGPLFANAGSFYYHLDVVSLSLAQHF